MGRHKLPRDKKGNIIRQKSDGLETKGIITTGEALEIVKKEQEKIILSNSLYSALFKTRGRVYTGTGVSASGAIAALAVRNVKGMGVLTVSKGDKSRTKILSAPQVYRLFSSSRLMREVVLKNVSALFQDV